MSPLSIRPAHEADLPQLTALYNHYVVHTPITFDLTPFSVREREPWFSQFREYGRYRLFVAERDGVLQGYAGTQPFRSKAAYDTSVETTVYCAADAVGRGIGDQLYRALFEALAHEDVHAFLAGITLPNPASIALHTRHGFVLSGVMHGVGRKHGTYWDVAWYERVVQVGER
jgi:phosphinothricin acetyltransferase